jgi:Asp-tRNA(Asn)/Glu-tRNA(Gln) amidotransferase A subunit family amidase
MKPTFNTMAGGGIKVVSLEFDTIGYFARCMEDLELITRVIGLPREESIKQIPLKEARVGFVKSPFWSSAGPGTVAAMEKAAEILRKHGVMIENVEFPDEFNDAAALVRMFKIIFVADSGASFYKDYLMDTTKTMLDPEVRASVEDAPKYPREEVRQAFDYYAALRPVLDKIATRYSALITPSATDEAPLGLGDMGSPVFNFVWTVGKSWHQQYLPQTDLLCLGSANAGDSGACLRRTQRYARWPVSHNPYILRSVPPEHCNDSQ